ncbi:MAG: hypothetical protein ACD_62C00093G0001 [uncultured bacterium]|nr:MAG: hypothetical protein ACD_62C00093G0001 [uncultured bacterium]
MAYSLESMPNAETKSFNSTTPFSVEPGAPCLLAATVLSTISAVKLLLNLLRSLKIRESSLDLSLSNTTGPRAFPEVIFPAKSIPICFSTQAKVVPAYCTGSEALAYLIFSSDTPPDAVTYSVPSANCREMVMLFPAGLIFEVSLK